MVEQKRKRLRENPEGAPILVREDYFLKPNFSIKARYLLMSFLVR